MNESPPGPVPPTVWQRNRAARGTGVACDSLFALSPVLLVILSIARRFFAEGQARGELVRPLQGVMGPETGLAVAALLFSAGKWLIGFLLGRTTTASQFGVAGSLVVVLLWVCYESASSGPS